MKRSLIIFSALMFLGGCSTISDFLDLNNDSPEELEKRRIEQLEVPPELSRAAINDSMAIPGGLQGRSSYSDMQKRKQMKDIITGKAGLKQKNDSANTTESAVSFVRSGNRMWLKVKTTKDVAFGKLASFFKNQEYPIKRKEKALLLIESDWMADTKSVPEGLLKGITALFGSPVKEKIRARIEDGEQEGIVEIFITRYAVERVLVDDIESGNVIFEHNAGTGKSSTKSHSWKPMTSDPAFESELIKKFALFIGLNQKATVKLADSAEEIKKTSKITTQEQQDILKINESFFSSWRMIGVAIDRASFTLYDKDRLNGKYYVRYDRTADDVEDEGFWSSIAFWKSDDNKGIDKLVIKIEDKGGYCSVTTEKEDGTEVPKDFAVKLLNLINEQLY